MTGKYKKIVVLSNKRKKNTAWKIFKENFERERGDMKFEIDKKEETIQDLKVDYKIKVDSLVRFD